jgi:hypothetical protein
MGTAETLALCLNHLQTELARADSQLDSLENISIALDNAEEEQALRNISAKSSRLDKQDVWGPSPARDFQARR